MRNYDKKNNRIVYNHKKATPEYWDCHWDGKTYESLIKNGKNDKFILSILNKYLPDKKGKILEGGCGTSRIVYCMYYHGYDAIGIDYAEKTVQKVNTSVPELNVRVGDVRNLEFPDDYFTAYWSLGVIEHFFEGYEEIANEMKRVLKKEGYLFLKFPYISPLRKLKAKLGIYKSFNGQNDSFYQFALDHHEVIEFFENKGFILIEKSPKGGFKGFKDEIKVLKPFLQRINDYNGKIIFINGLKFIFDKLLTPFSGHTIFIVFKNCS